MSYQTTLSASFDSRTGQSLHVCCVYVAHEAVAIATTWLKAKGYEPVLRPTQQFWQGIDLTNIDESSYQDIKASFKRKGYEVKESVF